MNRFTYWAIIFNTVVCTAYVCRWVGEHYYFSLRFQKTFFMKYALKVHLCFVRCSPYGYVSTPIVSIPLTLVADKLEARDFELYKEMHRSHGCGTGPTSVTHKGECIGRHDKSIRFLFWRKHV